MINADGSNVVITVDDSKTMRDMVSFTAREMGYEVLSACDGKEALEILAMQKVALVITDFNMPVMNGLELIGEIRKDTVNKKTPILMVTTESEQEKVMKAKALGATGWIVKPFSPEKLKTVIKKVCGDGPVRAV